MLKVPFASQKSLTDALCKFGVVSLVGVVPRIHGPLCDMHCWDGQPATSHSFSNFRYVKFLPLCEAKNQTRGTVAQQCVYDDTTHSLNLGGLVVSTTLHLSHK